MLLVHGKLTASEILTTMKKTETTITSILMEIHGSTKTSLMNGLEVTQMETPGGTDMMEDKNSGHQMEITGSRKLIKLNTSMHKTETRLSLLLMVNKIFMNI